MDKLITTISIPTYEEGKSLDKLFKQLANTLEREVYLEIATRINYLLGYEGSDTWDPGNIADGSFEAKEVTVNGANLGDYAIASFSLDVEDLILTANVTAANTVTALLSNNTGGAVNLGEGTVRVKVIPK